MDWGIPGIYDHEDGFRRIIVVRGYAVSKQFDAARQSGWKKCGCL